jgi:hypothetical protein
VHVWVIHACNLQQCPAGSLVWASDLARPAGFSPATWAELDPAQKKTSNIVGFLVYLVYGLLFFLYCGNTNLVLKYPVFSMKCCKYLYMSEKQKKYFLVCCIKNVFLCVAYGQYPNIFWIFSLKKNKYLKF